MDKSENSFASPLEQSSRPARDVVSPHRAVNVLIAGVAGVALTLIACLVYVLLAIPALGLAIPAWAIGFHDLRAIDAGVKDRAGRRATKAGMVLGMIGTILSALAVLGTIVVLYWTMLPPILNGSA